MSRHASCPGVGGCHDPATCIEMQPGTTERRSEAFTSRSCRMVPKPAGGSMRNASFSTASTYGNCEGGKCWCQGS